MRAGGWVADRHGRFHGACTQVTGQLRLVNPIKIRQFRPFRWREEPEGRLPAVQSTQNFFDVIASVVMEPMLQGDVLRCQFLCLRLVFVPIFTNFATFRELGAFWRKSRNGCAQRGVNI